MMKTHRLVLVLVVVASTVLVTGCAVETVSYSPGYTRAYVPAYSDVGYGMTYGSYPSYYWGYQTDDAPVYAVSSGWGHRGWGHHGWRHHGGHHRH